MLFLLFNLPSAQAADPAARWGHQAVFVDGSNDMYVVGGASSSSNDEVTNDVYILSLDDEATWTAGANAGLPAHAFAAMSLSGNTITVAGGMTSSCSSDAPIHTLQVGSTAWSEYSPSGFIRRHGAAAATTQQGTMIVGGLVDKYVCSSTTAGYAAFDLISSPSAAPASERLPYSLTGGKQSVSDFAMTSANGKVYLASGQSADGTLVPLNTIAIWTEADGWAPKMTSGNIPAARLGASLVAHPTLDALILFGGSTKVSSSSFGASGVVALLNTTTWEWSLPASLQPSNALAVSYHSSVMTPQGVMITAFGRNNMGLPTTGLNYLDMRDPSGEAWGWSSTWSKDYLSAYTAPKSTSADHGSKTSKGTIAAAVVPTIIGLLILIPLAIWFFRRHVKNSRHRRLTSHFDFAAQEDRGDFARQNGNRYLFNASFGSEGSLTSISRRVMTVFRRGSKGVGDDGTIHEGEMVQVAPAQLTQRGNNWEEIDFGLGRVDAVRREGNYTDLPARVTPRGSRNASGVPYPEHIPFPMPIASTIRYPTDVEMEADAVELENPFLDPSAVQNPFTDANAPVPPTPMAMPEPTVGQLVRIDNDSPRLGSPTGDGQVSLVHPQQESALATAGADAAATEANDWSMLEQAMMSRPVFQASSQSAVRSHSHAQSNSISSIASSTTARVSSVVRAPSPALSTISSVSSAPSIPPLPFQQSQSPTPGRTVSGSGSGAAAATVNKHSRGGSLGNATASRHLAGSGSPRRYSQLPSVETVNARRGSVNALGLHRGSRLRVANPSESGELE